jgi:molybdopterin-guanine dinucleotide biosynthesis adapter protein
MKVFAIAGYSGAGKTTLIEKLLPELIGRGLRVSVIKHAHHGFDIDRPGKDSYRQRQAGASEVMITSSARWALLHELRNEPEPSLASYLTRFSACDLVLVEGFKREPVPKLEVLREDNGKAPLYPANPQVLALATDLAVATGLPCFGLDDIAPMADFILAHAIDAATLGPA